MKAILLLVMVLLAGCSTTREPNPFDMGNYGSEYHYNSAVGWEKVK